MSNKQTIQEKIVGRTTHIVHLTHNDLDAAGSDAICRMTFGNEILTLFSSVGKFTWFTAQVSGCNGKGDTLIISDLGYQERARTNLISDMSNAYKNAHYFDPEKDDVQLVSGNYIIMNCGENVYVALVHLQKRVYPGHRRTEYKKGRRDRESRSFREFFCFAFTFSAYGQQRHIDGKRPPLRF